MASINNIKRTLDEISGELKRKKNNASDGKNKSYSDELFGMVAGALADEEAGNNTYDTMAELASKSAGEMPECTAKALNALFTSMADDERKHYKMLKAVDEISKMNKNKTDTSKECKKSYVFKIDKTNPERQIAFGFAMFSETADGKKVVDLQGDTITPEELETLAYNYVRNHRDVGQMHMTSGEGCVVESMVFTRDKIEALGLGPNVPVAWWVGLYIADPEVWARVKSGEYKAFSIEGMADREEVDM